MTSDNLQRINLIFHCNIEESLKKTCLWNFRLDKALLQNLKFQSIAEPYLNGNSIDRFSRDKSQMSD